MRAVLGARKAAQLVTDRPQARNRCCLNPSPVVGEASPYHSLTRVASVNAWDQQLMLFAAEGLGQRTVGSRGVKLIVAVAGLSRGVGSFGRRGSSAGINPLWLASASPPSNLPR